MKIDRHDGTVRRTTIQFVIEMVIVNVVAAVLVFRMGGSPSGIIIGIVGLCVSFVMLFRLFQHVDGIVARRLEQVDR